MADRVPSGGDRLSPMVAILLPVPIIPIDALKFEGIDRNGH